MGEQTTLEELFKAMKVLNTTSDSGTVQDLTDNLKESVASFKKFLSNNNICIENLKSDIVAAKYLLKVDNNYISWCYTFHCLRILSSLCSILIDSPHAVVSVGQQKQVLNCVEFIVVLGISPSLIPGVGIAMQKRTSFADFVQVFHDNSSVWVKHSRLVICIEVLFRCIENQHLGSIILSRYLPDLLSALLQLCHAPLKKPEADPVDGMTFGKYKELLIQKQKFCDMLDSLCSKTYTPALIQNLITLQSSVLTGNKKTPKWLKDACGDLLTKLLLGKYGFESMIQSFMIDDSSQSNSPKDKMCETLAQLICSIPKNLTAEEYIHNISSQVLTFMNSSNEHSATMNRFISLIINNFLTSHPEITRKYFLQRLGTSLLKLGEQELMLKPNEVIVLPAEISSAVHNLSLLCAKPGELHPNVMDLIASIYPVLFALYSYAETVSCLLRKPLLEVLVKYLQSSNIEGVAQLLDGTLSEGSKFRQRISFLLDDEHCIIAVTKDCTRDAREIEDEEIEIDQMHANGIITILSETSDDAIRTKFFFFLLQNLTDILNEQRGEANSVKTESYVFSLEFERCQKEKEYKLRKDLFLLSLVSNMVDKFSLQLLKEKEEIIKFSCCTLERGANLCNGERDSWMMMEAETLIMAMVLLTTILRECAQLTANEKRELFASVASLEVLHVKHPLEEIKEMAKELKTQFTICEQRWLHKNDKNIQKSKKSSGKEAKSEVQRSGFKEAWHDLSDPLLPARGHGLLSLTNLINNKDPETLKNKQKILIMFQESISNEDSYIYLAAIQGLAALCNSYPDEVIKHLTSEFIKLDSDGRSVEVQMKVGEVLMKASRNLGEIIPKYRNILLNTFLTGLKSSEGLIRASCLSNIGEMCKGLRFSLGPYLQEILLCLRCAISETEEKEVRRAAVLVITLLFKGCGVDTLKVLGREIRDIYRALKLILRIDKDEVVRVHARFALEELNEIMKKNMLPKQKLVKEIKILHPK